MGLLDAFNTDEGLLGLALMAAGAPKLGGRTSIGEGLLGALQTVQQRKMMEEDRKQKAAFQAAQMQHLMAQAEENKAQAAQRGAEVERKKRLDEMLGQVFGGAQPSQYGVAGGGVNLGGVTEPMRPKAGGLQGADINMIAKLQAMGGPNLLDAYKVAQTGIKMDPGAYYALNGQQRYMGDPTKGITLSGDGSVQVMPNAPQALAELAGATKEAEARASARYQPITGLNERNEPSILGSAADILEGLRKPQPTADRDLMARFGDTRADFNIGGKQWSVGQPSNARQGGIKTGLGPRDKWTYDRERAVMVNEEGESRNVKKEDGAPLRSPKQATEDKSNQQFLSATSMARDLLQQGPTESGIGTAYDRGAAFFGKTPKGADIAKRLESISGWLTSNVPRMEGPQSNYDVNVYKQMAGQVGDSTLPVKVRMAALDTVEGLIRRYADISGGPAMPQSDGGAPPAKSGFKVLGVEGR